jgi:adenine-specific DNA-methyltransferase
VTCRSQPTIIGDMIRPGDSLALRRDRGAFFTPPAIADYLADWAVGNDPVAKVLDPTCGEAIFLLAAGRRLRRAGLAASGLNQHLFGVDLHQASLDWAMTLLEEDGLDATLLERDFFDLPTPDELGSPLPLMDAVIGNPPFVRYQKQGAAAQAKARRAALRQGVRLSGLTSSWASLLIHACAFLKSEGRLAMVLPAELLTVGYAEPIRVWLRQRFEQVHLVLFERLQFDDAVEKVVLVLAAGHGGCDAFSLYYLDDAEDLRDVRPMTNLSVTPADAGKWTELLLPNRQRQLFKQASSAHFLPLSRYGSPELGTVTGGNAYFTLSQATADRYGLSEEAGHLRKVCPPGTKHMKGLSFSVAQWRTLRDAGEPAWLLYPDPADTSPALRAYVLHGEQRGVHNAYKCRVRTPWWRPPVVQPPDLFFTYMSHRYPRLFTNTAGTTFVNSMHGIRLGPGVPSVSKAALPLLAFNSLTMLGAEIFGRSYGGGVLKMEPREAATLPVPDFAALTRAWAALSAEKAGLERQLRDGRWTNVVKRVDEVLLQDVLGLPPTDVIELHQAARTLRAKRIGPEFGDDI